MTSAVEIAEDLLQQDMYGNVQKNPLDTEYSDQRDKTFSQEHLAYSQSLFEDDYKNEFHRSIKTLQLTPSVRSKLYSFYKVATTDDIVLGRFSVKDAEIFLLELAFDMDRAKIGLRDEDVLSVYSGAWDYAVTIIKKIAFVRICRAIDGFERLSQITQRSFISAESTESVTSTNRSEQNNEKKSEGLLQRFRRK